jgi:HAMP domain-containing protein
MDAAAVIRKYGSTVLGTIGVALWLAALYLLGFGRAEFRRVRSLAAVDPADQYLGLLTLFVLLAGKLTRLVRDYRRHVPGSRLKGRTVAIFSAWRSRRFWWSITFSLQFINRGIDSWFELEVSQGLKDTRELSHAALEVRVREFLQHTQVVAHTLSQFGFRADRHAGSGAAREHGARVHHRRRAGADSRHQFRSAHGCPAGARHRRDDAAAAARPALREFGHRLGGRLRDSRRGAARRQWQRRRQRVLIALYPVPQQLSQLADTVQRSYTQYANLVQLRRPLKSTFVLILTFVVLMSLIAAVYGAFFAAQRLVQPVQDLIAGTRAVAKGNYDTKLPLPSRDELGFLVTSFNDMTKRLGRAREETRRSQQAVEAERAGLAVILARLSTGVVSLEADLTVRTANQAASAILGVDLEAAVGKRFDESISDTTLFTQFLAALKARLAAEDWIGASKSNCCRIPASACSCAPARRCPTISGGAPGSGAGVRRHHHAAAGAARRCLGRSGAPPRARNQESAHPDSTVGRAHAAQVLGQHECGRRSNSGARHAHHRGPGRCHETDGQCLQRIRARARHAFFALRSESADHRGGGSVPGAGFERRIEADAEPAAAADFGRPDADTADSQQSGHQLAGGPRGPAGARIEIETQVAEDGPKQTRRWPSW